MRGIARERLSGNFGTTIRAYVWSRVIMVCITWLSMSISQSGTGGRVFYVIIYFLSLIITGIFDAGSAFLYLHVVSGREASPGMVFSCFRNHTDKTVLITLYRLLLEALASITFAYAYVQYVINGQSGYLGLSAIGLIVMIAGYLLIWAIYLPAYYLIHDFPDYGALEIIRLCPKLTLPRLGRMVMLFVGMIPLKLLEVLSLGVGAPWAESYVNAIMAEYYLDLMNPGLIPAGPQEAVIRQGAE